MQQTASEHKKWLKEELTRAYKTARLGKSGKPQVADFEKVAKSEIKLLAREVYSRTVYSLAVR